MGITVNNIKRYDTIRRYDLFEFRKLVSEWKSCRRMNNNVHSCQLWVDTPFHLMTDGYYTDEYMSTAHHDDGYEIIADFAYFAYDKLTKVHPDVLRINYKIYNISTELPSKLVEEIITSNFEMSVRLKYVCDITNCSNGFYKARHKYMKTHRKSYMYTEYAHHECGICIDEHSRDIGIHKYAVKELYNPETNYYDYKELERDIWRNRS